MLSGGGGEDAIDFRDGENAVDVGEPVEVGDDLAVLHVEDDELIGVHVGDVEASIGAVEALVVEADGWAGERDVGDLFERSRP